MPDEGLAAVWNAMLARLDAFFEEAARTADSAPYRDYQYVRGYRAGLEMARKLVEGLRAEPQQPPEEPH